MKYAAISVKTNKNDKTVARTSCASTFIAAASILSIGPLFLLLICAPSSRKVRAYPEDCHKKAPAD
jgi:hypothetical protein